MGTESADCFKVARMIGIKTFLNEYVAYIDLGEIVNNKKLFDEHVSLGGNYSYNGSDIILHLNDTHSTVLEDGIMSVSVTQEMFAIYFVGFTFTFNLWFRSWWS